MSLQRVKDLLRQFLNHPFIKTPLLAFAIVAVAVIVFFGFLHVFSRHGRSFPVPDFSGLTIDQAHTLAKQSKLRLEVTDSVYILTRKPGSVVEQNPNAGTFVKANRRVFITTNAVSPILEEMPNIVGLTLRQAKSVLQLHGFKLGNLAFVPDIAVNNVLEQRHLGQEIEPGTPVPRGVEISLVLGKGLYNEKTVLPRVIGLTLAEARNLLQDASLNLGRYTFDATVIDNIDSLQARVYSQYPNPVGETYIDFGARVNLWLTQNESRIPPEPEPETDEEEDAKYSLTEPDEEIIE